MGVVDGSLGVVPKLSSLFYSYGAHGVHGFGLLADLVCTRFSHKGQGVVLHNSHTMQCLTRDWFYPCDCWVEVVQVLDTVGKVDGGGEVGGLLCWQGSVFLFVAEVGVVQVLDSVDKVIG